MMRMSLMPIISALLPRRLELAALAEIGGEGDDLGAEFGLQPFQDDGGVEAAGIGEHDLLDVFCFRHFWLFRDRVLRGRGITAFPAAQGTNGARTRRR